MAQHTLGSLSHLPPHPFAQQVTLGILHGRHHRELTELMVRLALRGPFHFIAGGEWIPDQDEMRRAVRRYTTQVNEVLDHLKLGRPSTCLQLRDQLQTAGAQPYPILITDFLNRFYDPDVNSMLRQRVLEECCIQVTALSQKREVFLLLHYQPVEDYHLFLPLLELLADEVIEINEQLQPSMVQYSLL